MSNSPPFAQRHKNLCCCCSFNEIPCFRRSKCIPFICCFRLIVRRINQLSMELLYFLSLSAIGFLILKAMKPRTEFRPRNLDLFFTSVSASTVSSMSTVEMEVFSNSQLIILTILMFIGGEVFTSMVGLHIRGYRLSQVWQSGTRIGSISSDSGSSAPLISPNQSESDIIPATRRDSTNASLDSIDYRLTTDSIKFLGFVVLGYLLVIQFLGVAFVFGYMNFVSSAKDVLKTKGLKQFTFAIFTVVSTFASCGFIPTNENMIVFSKNSGLLLILIPQILFGNTLFPSCLRYLLWFLGKYFKKLESQYLLNNTEQIGYSHLLPSLHSSLLVVTVLGFIFIQFILFCSLEWNSAGLSELNTYQKIVGILFQTTNARHAGETIIDISTIAQAILVVFIIMMVHDLNDFLTLWYLPPYTSFLPAKDEGESTQDGQFRNERRARLVDNFLFSQLSYLAIFIVLICITERKRLKEDPLNFNVLNITVEVISAYGNVGFTTGYSCERQLKADLGCENKWFGFAGKWSDEGKLILVVVMFFGRLKKFNMDGGKAWKLL